MEIIMNRIADIVKSLIFIVLFNIIFFVSGGAESNAVQWTGYIFIHISYAAILLVTFVFSKQRSPELNYPLRAVSGIYFGVDFLVSLIFILISPENLKLEIIIQLVILSVYVYFILKLLMANDETAELLERQNADKKYITESCGRLKVIMENVSDKSLYKKLERAHDIIYASPVKSNDGMKQQENAVLFMIENLKKSVESGNMDECDDLIKRIITVAQERNNGLK